MKNQIKYLQNLFYDMINDYGRVYIVIKYSKNSIIGTRGFTEEEKKKGLVLVFNRNNHKNLQWTEDGSLIATLGFGTGNRPERCFLHYDDIVSVFSPDTKIRFERWDMWDTEEQTEEIKETTTKNETIDDNDKIVSLDSFRKTKV